MNATLAGKLCIHPQDAAERGFSPEHKQPLEPSALSSEGAADAESEAEIARMLRPLLAADETLRRCAGCHRAFVMIGNPPRMQAYCSLAACQLKCRKISSS